MDETDICNRALAILGHDRTIASYDGTDESGAYSDTSTEAVRCRLFYPSALASALEAHDWDWAAVERDVAPGCADDGGRVRVALPEDCLRLVRVTDPAGHALRTTRNRRELLVQAPADFVRLRFVTSDVGVDEMPPRFVEALAYGLAYLLSGPMFGDERKSEGFMQLAKIKLSEAATTEANETAFPGEWDNPLLKARR